MFPQLSKPPVLCCWTEQESMEEVRTKHGYTICGYGYGSTICGYKRPIYSAIMDTRYVDTKDQYLLQLWIQLKCGWYLFRICPQDFLAVAATAQKMD